MTAPRTEPATGKAHVAAPTSGGMQTQQAILNAAQKRLARLGSEGLRLQDIARDAGVSHPTILHHFGSRDGLIVALVRHVGNRLVEELLAHVEHEGDVRHSSPKVDLVFSLFTDQGFGTLIGWAYRQRPADVAPLGENLFHVVFESMVAFKTARDGAPPNEVWCKDLSYCIRMAIMAATGEAIIGKPFPMPYGTQADFRHWMGNLIHDKVDI